MVNIIKDLELAAQKVRAGFVFVFHAIEHEVPAILGVLVNVYGPDVVAHAVATYKGNAETYADKEAGVAEADLKALVQSSVVEKFGLPSTAGQFIASGIHHLFTVGEAKMNSLIEAGATAIESDVAGSQQAAPQSDR